MTKKPVDARKRDVNAKNAPDWSTTPSKKPRSTRPQLIEAAQEPDHIDTVEGELDFQQRLDRASAQGKPVTSPADTSNPSAKLERDLPHLSDADRAAALRSHR